MPLSALLVGLFLFAACSSGQAPLPPVPTNTPLPTFTPTPTIVMTPVDPAAAATARAAAAQQAQNTGAQTGAQPQEPATATPTPEPVAIVDIELMNVRGGPGTNYRVIGTASRGSRFRVIGKNPAGDWWEVDFNGQRGWLFGELVTTQNVANVPVETNIPTPPPTPTPLPPTPTPTPAPPTPTPTPRYKFNIAVFGGCEPNAGVTYVKGTTYVNGVPTSGYWVAFSWMPDGPIVAKIQSGPHEGYPDWAPGFYTHILQANGPREGTWYFWIVDENDRRISEMVQVRTDGEAGPGKCQQAIVDFDSR